MEPSRMEVPERVATWFIELMLGWAVIVVAALEGPRHTEPAVWHRFKIEIVTVRVVDTPFTTGVRHDFVAVVRTDDGRLVVRGSTGSQIRTRRSGCAGRSGRPAEAGLGIGIHHPRRVPGLTGEGGPRPLVIPEGAGPVNPSWSRSL